MKRKNIMKALAMVCTFAVTISTVGSNAYAVTEDDTYLEVSGGDALQDSDKEADSSDVAEDISEDSVAEDKSAAKDEATEGDVSENDSANEDTSEDDALAVSDGDAGEVPADPDESEEDKKDEPLKSGEFHYETEADGYQFIFSADENVVPDGTTAEVKLIEDDDAIVDEIQSTLDRTIIESDVFDIKLIDEEGEEVQPEEGSVHISLKLSDEAIVKQEELDGEAELRLIHVHDEDTEELKTETTKEDSDIEIPSDVEEEVVVSEDMIDPETQQLLPGADLHTTVLGSSDAPEYYQNITLDFDADSFSTFAVLSVASYSFAGHTTVSGNETVINLTGMESDLVNDFRNVVQDALTEAWSVTKNDQTKYFKVIIPPGTYAKKDATNPIHIGSNTTLYMQGVTIVNEKDGRMLVCKKLTDGSGKYNDYQNIVIDGGCFDGNAASDSSMIKLAHINGLEIKNVTMKNGAAPHMLEIAACNNVKVTGCSFRDTMHGSNELEAFQIDIMKEGAFTYDIDPVYDDYPCKNVEVANCTFSNLYRGFGSHGAVAGAFYYSNVNVHNCTFENIINTAVMSTMWKDSKVTNNTFNNVGRGIDTTTYSWYTNYPTKKKDRNVDSLSYNANMEISNNTINIGGSDRNSGTWAGVLLSGYYCADGDDATPQGLYTISGFNVTGNTIEGYKDWGSYNQDDLYADVITLYAKGANINNNTLNANQYGILVQAGGEASNLDSNNFGGERDASIAVKHGGIVYDMSGNKLTKDCPFGIYVDDESSCNGTCEAATYTMAAGESLSTRNKDFSLFTNDLSTKVKGTYSSSKKSVAKVTKAGKIKGVKKGKATVTASWGRGNGVVNVTLTANIKKAPTKVKLAKKKSIKKGSTYQLKPKVNSGSMCSKYTYKSANKKIATVSKTGLVKAKKKGTTTITVKTYNGVTAKITIKVK